MNKSGRNKYTTNISDLRFTGSTAAGTQKVNLPGITGQDDITRINIHLHRN